MSHPRVTSPVLATVRTAFVAALALSLAACGSSRSGGSSDDDPGFQPQPPTHPENLVEEPEIEGQSNGWNAAELACEDNSDCLDHETCFNNVCQIDRCVSAEYESLAPMGDSYLFYADLEFGIVDTQNWSDEYWVDGYAPEDSEIEYSGSWNLGSAPAIDIAGGDLFGDDQEIYAVILEDTGEVIALTDSGLVSQPLPLLPRAIAAGDIDSDSVDEIVVAGVNMFAVCDMQLSYCQPFDLDSDYEVIDVSVGDVDGDLLREAVFLVETPTGLGLHVENFDADENRQEETWFMAVEDDIHKVAAGDLDGDGRAEIVVLREGGWWNTNDDELDVYRLVAGPDTSSLEHFVHMESGFNRLTDIDIGDIDGSDVAELILLDEHQKLAVARLLGDGIDIEWTTEFTITGQPSRISMADRDSDSPRAVLSGGPEVVPGASVPVVAMLLPPYSYEYSAGFSSTGYGMAETLSETYSDTVSMSVGMDVGVSGNFLGLFAAKYSEKVGASASMTLGENQTRSTGNRSGMRSQPDDFGFNYGAVVVSWGCFHAYTYEITDPSGLVPGSDGELVVLTVPVDSGTAMLSTNRYNAMATAVGDLPIIEAPYTIGDLYDYPTEPETIYGEPIEEDQYVFPDLDWYEVSDVGYVGWFNVVGESVTNSSSYGMDMGVSAGVTVSGIAVGMSTSAGWGKGYSLTLGETALFSGGIPPFRDDPDTEVDEYADNFYRVAPIVYMQDYTDAEGNTSAFYVQTYAIDMGN